MAHIRRRQNDLDATKRYQLIIPAGLSKLTADSRPRPKAKSYALKVLFDQLNESGNKSSTLVGKRNQCPFSSIAMQFLQHSLEGVMMDSDEVDNCKVDNTKARDDN